jgi:hypothetical protein
VKNLIQRLTRRAVGEICYRICESLDGYAARPTTCTKLAASDAIAISWMLDWKRALTEDNDSLPSGIASALGAFSTDDWPEVMGLAADVESFMESHLKRPEWEHLRRKPLN